MSVTACLPPMPYNEEVTGPSSTEEAVELTAALWAARLGVEIYFDLPPVRWFDGCLEYDPNDDPSGGSDGCLYGVFWHGFGIAEEIHLKVEETVGASGLAHEMLHWALWASSTSSDPGHTHPLWDVVGEVKMEIANAGM